MSNDSLMITVTDDRWRFDVAAAERGTGLQGMADRSDAIAGALLIESHVGHETTVRGSVPAEGAS